MKIAISALEPDVDGQIDLRFGRTQFFLIINPDTMKYEALPNPNTHARDNTGIQSAQLIGNTGAEAVITGQVGPNAFRTLSAIGVRIYQTMGGTVRQAIEAYNAGRLPMVSNPGPSHALWGMGGGMIPGPGGAGRGGDGRFGRARAGRGWRRSPEFDAGLAQQKVEPGQAPVAGPQMPKEQEIQILKQQAEGLARQLDDITKRLQRLEAKDTKTQ